MSHRIPTPDYLRVTSALAAAIVLASCGQPREPAAPAEPELTPEMSVTKQSTSLVPMGPWGDGDQVGMAHCAPLAPAYFNFRKTTIYGGSNEVQRNLVAQTVLG